jgi:hypothetical protein
VIQWLKDYGAVSVREMEGEDENVVFAAPLPE